jgi:hypothetical protein
MIWFLGFLAEVLAASFGRRASDGASHKMAQGLEIGLSRSTKNIEGAHTDCCRLTFIYRAAFGLDELGLCLFTKAGG